MTALLLLSDSTTFGVSWKFNLCCSYAIFKTKDFENPHSCRSSSKTARKTSPPPMRFSCLFLRRHSPWAGWAGITNGEAWRCFINSYQTEVLSPGVAEFIGFAAQAKPVQFESAGASALHTLPFGLSPGDAVETQGIGIFSAEVCW